MTTEIENVKQFLISKSLQASPLWIKGCIDWFKSEHTSPYSLKELCAEIYDQWLLVDLRDMEVSCFPENLSSYTKITLPGRYAVQIEYIKDISQPCYQQLQKIRNCTNNILDEEKFNQSKTKSNRMLQLHVCDGVQELLGTEYRPIKKLHPNLTPGMKLMIKGPIDCRRGVLLMQEHNVEILGGEIDDILVKNAFENILARSLGLPENPEPYKDLHKIETGDIDEIWADELDVDQIDEIVAQDVKQAQSSTTANREDDFPSTNNETFERNDYVNMSVIDNDIARMEQEMEDTDYGSNEFPSVVLTTNTAENRNKKNLTNTNLTCHEKQLNAKENAESDLKTDKDLLDDAFTVDDIDSLDKLEQSFEESKINTPDKKKHLQILSSQPFIYINQLNEIRDDIEPGVYTIKAKTDSLVGKLSFVNNRFHLKYKLTDGTGVITAEFSNSVFEDILGYTSEQMAMLRKLNSSRTNTIYKDQIIQSLEKAQKKLIELDCFMDLQFTKDKENPVIIKLKDNP